MDKPDMKRIKDKVTVKLVLNTEDPKGMTPELLGRMLSQAGDNISRFGDQIMQPLDDESEQERQRVWNHLQQENKFYFSLTDKPLPVQQFRDDAEVLLKCWDKQEALVHWLWEMDCFVRENGEFLDDAVARSYLIKAGATHQQVDEILKVMHREDAEYNGK